MSVIPFKCPYNEFSCVYTNATYHTRCTDCAHYAKGIVATGAVPNLQNFITWVHKSWIILVYYLLPTLALKARWLRKYNIYVILEETETFAVRTGIGFYYSIKTVDLHTKEHISLDFSSWFYGTYEQALKKGLKSAITFVK